MKNEKWSRCEGSWTPVYCTGWKFRMLHITYICLLLGFQAPKPYNVLKIAPKNLHFNSICSSMKLKYSKFWMQCTVEIKLVYINPQIIIKWLHQFSMRGKLTTRDCNKQSNFHKTTTYLQLNKTNSVHCHENWIFPTLVSKLLPCHYDTGFGKIFVPLALPDTLAMM